MTPTEFEDRGIELALWLFRLALIVAFAILIYFIMISLANAVECQHRPDNRGNWTWRYVEPHAHARCWYRGRHVVPKSQLHWRSEKPKPVKMDLPNGIRADEQEPDIDDATECCWPQLPIADGSGNMAPAL